MVEKNTGRFLYHAHAEGLSGRITLPFHDVIEVQGVSALPMNGGHSTSRVEGFRYKNILSTGPIHTLAIGELSQRDPSYHTVAIATIEKLDILGLLTAERIVARIMSKHPVGKGAASIMVVGSRFEGLRIGGVPVEVELFNHDEHDSLNKLRARYREDAEFRKELNKQTCIGRAKDLPEEVRRHFPWAERKAARELPESNGMTSIPLVKQLIYKGNHFTNHGNVIHIPQFGTVTLGELIVTQNSRRLAMLQVHLGCGTEGDVSIGSGEGNGSPMPPLPGSTPT